MALPPDSSETFLREVDENLRRDRVRDFAKSYGGWIIAAALLFLALVGAWLYWQDRQKRQAAEQSEQLSQVLQDISARKTQTVPQRLEALTKDGDGAMRASALFTSAALSLQSGNRNAALATYRTVRDDKGLSQPHRDLALIHLTALEFDSIKPDEVIARLAPLAKSGNPWFGSAGELSAMALLKQNKTGEAGRMFAAIAADKQVPESIRSRAIQIAGTLGVDASASLPTAAQ